MSQFYGTVTGQARTQATRRGSGSSGLETVAASVLGAVRVSLYLDSKGEPQAQVELSPWGYRSAGETGPTVTLYQGPIDPATRRRLAQERAK